MQQIQIKRCCGRPLVVSVSAVPVKGDVYEVIMVSDNDKYDVQRREGTLEDLSSKSFSVDSINNRTSGHWENSGPF